ncbi:hypothetical protein [Jatrophihabitans endophyticus]|uniref:WD40/YVTN/BNR-like repeat-containing protein n=1 Tax=Jatrophihabitans endophyticus TaxID=1206085 RepID=UPI0019FED97C|nr:hypothetical protein [Jatrophihabitans endophyticus]MBE7189354.1 hypothetical protein [Jatrophihabitans endophyticus]
MNLNPFHRRHLGGEDTPVESALRRSLAGHAFDTPDADELTRRILAAAEDEPEHLAAAGSRRPIRDERPDRGPWKTWGLPLVAAASVAAIVGVGLGIAAYDNHQGHGQQAATRVPSTAHATVTTTQTVTAPAPAPSASGSGTSGLTNVKILDLTFYGTNDGIALASAHCLSGPGRCTALLQTTDGSTWTATGGDGRLGFDVKGDHVGCPVSRCVDHIRFASASVGYAYGPGAFFMTTDGTNWHREPGGAAALETLDNNVIRVGPATPSCLPDCAYTVQTAGIGSRRWTTVPLPGGTPTGVGVQLSRGGGNSYLLVTRNPAGGSNDATSTLYASSDKGASWTDEDEPCPQGAGGEVDSYQVAAGNGDDVAVLCRDRARGPFRVAVSTDGGANFTLRSGSLAFADVARTGYTDGGGALPGVLAGDASTVLAVAGQGVSVSRDGGGSWNQAADLTGSFAGVGFENQRVGRAVTADGSQIWTTRNAGRTWHESTP